MKAAGSIANATTSILSGTRINLFLKLNTCQIQLTSARQRISYRTSSRFSRTSIYTIFRGSRATELIFGSGSRIVRTTVWIACIDCRKSTVAFAQACAVCSPVAKAECSGSGRFTALLGKIAETPFKPVMLPVRWQRHPCHVGSLRSA